MCTSYASAQEKSNHGALDQMKYEGEGFYYYDDGSLDKNGSKKPPKKVKMKASEKVQADLTQELISQMRKNNELQEKILKKLEYAFPRTIPEFTTNKKTGKQCKSNSSADCFVMPVIAEAQNSVPVMVEMLRDPNMNTVKNYLEWQAVYLNQTFQVGRGFSLVSKQYEREVNKLDGTSYTNMSTHRNLEKDMANVKKSAVLMRLKKKIGLMIFIGKSYELERQYNTASFTSILNSVFPQLDNFTFVFYDQKSLDDLNKRLHHKLKGTNSLKKWEAASKFVNPNLFEKHKINASPAGLLVYKKDDGEIITQKLGYATLAPSPLLHTIYNFLRFNNIVEPGTINEKDAWEMGSELRRNKKIDKNKIDAIKIDESNLKINTDQVINKDSK